MDVRQCIRKKSKWVALSGRVAAAHIYAAPLIASAAFSVKFSGLHLHCDASAANSLGIAAITALNLFPSSHLAALDMAGVLYISSTSSTKVLFPFYKTELLVNGIS